MNHNRSHHQNGASASDEELRKNLEVATEKAMSEGVVPLPVNLHLELTTPIDLPRLRWHNYDLVPKKMKITNTGITVVVSGRWMRERSYLSGGPLRSSYVFSQIHFHWGATDLEGSEHLVNGQRMPLEMHVVHFRSRYITQEAALKEHDGLCVLAYLFKLQKLPNPNFDMITDYLEKIRDPHVSVHIDPQPLTVFLGQSFPGDYFMYWGGTETLQCQHAVLWLVCREPFGISSQQIAKFRTLRGLYNQPLLRNFREANMADARTVYHVLPGPNKTSVLHGGP